MSIPYYLSPLHIIFAIGIDDGAAVMAIIKSVESSSLAEVIDRIPDKGIVIDAFVKVSLVGIEVLTIEARIYSFG